MPSGEDKDTFLGSARVNSGEVETVDTDVLSKGEDVEPFASNRDTWGELLAPELLILELIGSDA